ncbi:MAG: PglZ domain-containing protein, partial [Fermentimonas sp.]|nr:PglZ domain-containing protein [Fermentimonas sp.]MDD4523702.1 PglZ domain-containing protein [Methanosarcina sp.]
ADINNTLDSSEGMIVKSPQDYVEAYKVIQQAIYRGEEMKLLVKNRYCYESFKKMQNNYGEEYIELLVYSPRQEFIKLYGLEVPEYITDIDIVNAGILKNPDYLQRRVGLDFESFIIANYVSEDLAVERFPVNRLISILEKIDFASFENNRTTSLVSKVIELRMNQWKENASASWINNLIDRFVENPQKLYEDLCTYLLISRYPSSIAQAVIGDIVEDFTKARFESDDFYNQSIDYSKVRKEIAIYLNSLPDVQLEYDEISQWIDTVSGCFLEEFDFVLRLLKNNVAVIDQDLLEKTLVKFRLIEQLVTDYDEKINAIMPPLKPCAPSESFCLQDWLNWSIKQYLPYRFWMEDNDKYDESVDTYSAAYGEWIYKNYNLLLSSEKNMVFNTVMILNNELMTNELSLIVIIDNFNYKYVNLVKEYFLEKGYSTVEETPLLAMLPTVTEVSKKSIFTGEAYDNKVGINYQLEAQKWEKMLGKSIKYLKNIGELSSINSKQEDVIFLNYLEIDDLLHKKQTESALSTRSKVKNELNALCQAIAAFAKRIGYENKIKIYITSDHGSTKLRNEQTNLIEQTYYKGKSDRGDHRYVVVTDENMDTLHSSIDQYCYVLDKTRFGTRVNYLIAKRYYRFKDTDDYYVHGGITPEEHVVPLLKFEHLEIKVQDLIISLGSNEFRLSAKSKIHLIVKNPNEYAVTNIIVKIINDNIRADLKSVEVKSLDKISVMDLYLDNVRFVKTGSTEDGLNIRVDFNFLGKACRQECNLPIVIKSMQQNTMNFDDLF